MTRRPAPLAMLSAWAGAIAIGFVLSVAHKLGPDDITAEQDSHDAQQLLRDADAIRQQIEHTATEFCRFFGKAPRWTVGNELDCIVPVEAGVVREARAQ